MGTHSSFSSLKTQASSAATKIQKLLQAQPGTVGVRLGMTNDWGSSTGFTYTLGFVNEGAVDPTDERIELPGGDGDGAIFVERKALWVGEGGLVGATIDLDDDFNLVVTPKDEVEPPSLR